MEARNLVHALNYTVHITTSKFTLMHCFGFGCQENFLFFWQPPLFLQFTSVTSYNVNKFDRFMKSDAKYMYAYIYALSKYYNDVSGSGKI